MQNNYHPNNCQCFCSNHCRKLHVGIHLHGQTDRRTDILIFIDRGQALIGANATHHIVDGVSKRLITMHKVHEKQ